MMCEEKTVDVDYQCLQCKAKDRGKFFIGDERPAPALTCYSCKAGYGMSADEQAMRRIGMLPVQPVAETVH